ncbi:hypothetical protein E2P81_ATG10138 [Venturia nashicola]|nr:hypothetical protein E2P81_ATG10138 [Venturia nashicola]
MFDHPQLSHQYSEGPGRSGVDGLPSVELQVPATLKVWFPTDTTAVGLAVEVPVTCMRPAVNVEAEQESS